MLKKLILGIAISGALAANLVFALGTESTPETDALSPHYIAGKSAVELKNWAVAITSFKKVIAADAGNADAHNYLGYAYRHVNKMDDSFKHYGIALKLDPNHRGAHEYVGQAYLKINKLDKAQEHLARLEKICGLKCEEYQDLAKSVAAYQAPKK